MGKNSHYATGDPELQGAIDAILSQRKIILDHKILKKGMNERIDARTKTLNFDNVILGEVRIPVEGGEITGVTYRPKGKESEILPLLVDFHEGGFCLGQAAMDHPLCLELCIGAGVMILNVEYRLAPDFPFPTLVDDGYAAVKWAAEHTKELGVDLSKGFFLCGSSAGACIAAASTIRARTDQSFKAKLTGQVLIIPNLYSKNIHPIEKYKEYLTSYEENTNDPVIPHEIIGYLEGIYDKGLTREQIASSDRSPLMVENFEGLPRAVMCVGGQDPLRDEGLLYAELLKKANGEDSVRLNIYPNAFHAFFLAVPESGASKKLVKDVINGLKWMMGDK